MKNVVILGGSYAGLNVAHNILKQSSKTTPVKVTLVTPNTHMYWSLASPLGIIPDQLTDEQLFQPIAAGFKQYPAGRFEFIPASAENLDFEAKTVRISDTAGSKLLGYDFLVIATGSRSKGGTPLKGVGSTEATKDALHEYQARVKAAKTIVVGGAGVTGCEVAGELGFVYGAQKKITLIAAGPTVLDSCPAAVSRTATDGLKNLKVEIKLQERIDGSVQHANGQHELTLSNGSKLVADMYIPAFGLEFNTSFVPKSFLVASGAVAVDEFLQLNGAGPVWAVGDVNDAESAQYYPCNRQAKHAAKNILLLLGNRKPLPYKRSTTDGKGLSIGRNGGTGHFGAWKIPSFIIVFARKSLFRDWMIPTVDGSQF